MSFLLNQRAIGEGARCFVIAEAGVNHNGQLDLAHRLVDAAADSGADAVKFQTFEADALAAEDAPKAEYQKKTAGAAESQRDMLRKLMLSEQAHVELKRHAEERGLFFFSTPFDERSAELLDRVGIALLKVPSGELTNLPFLRSLARRRLPMILSTGMADLDEVAAAVDVVRASGLSALALLHCTSSYPAPPESVNLRAMQTLRAQFGVPVGYSDHTRGAAIPIAAVALGACILEKHLTLDRNLPGPDHTASMEPVDFRAMVEAVRATEMALGDGSKRPHSCELDVRRVARKSLFTARPIDAGAALCAEDLVARRPAGGISPAALDRLIGRRLKRRLAEAVLLDEGDLE